jgi:L-ascorbate metabolism protein UlaG (beta-lactamase superfamily)
MLQTLILLMGIGLGFLGPAIVLGAPAPEVFKTSRGDLKILLFKHASLRLLWDGKVIDVDPVSSSADYASLPKADLILVTHGHSDHFDPTAIARVRTDATRIILSTKAAEKLAGTAMANGDTQNLLGLTIEAVPAYNLVHMRSPNVPFHPRGEGNGYVLTVGGLRLYIAGDTENTPEMKVLKNIDVAFVPMNLPYTMSPEMAADAVRAFRPKVVYPYHYQGSDPRKLEALLKDTPGVEVRVRNFY